MTTDATVLADLKTATDIASNLATILALLVGAWWAYRRSTRERESHAKIDLTVEVEFLGIKDQHWLVHLTGRVSNSGTVRHWIRDLRFELRALRSTTRLVDGGAQICNQIEFPELLKSASWLPPSWEKTFVDAGVENVYRHLAAIPVEVPFILLNGTFRYDDASAESHHSVRAFRIPEAPVGLALHAERDAC